jgi:predicted O-methyltransferase YrrM
MKRWSERSTPGEMKAQPWMNAGAVEFLGRLLRPEWHVLEHGSGGSTLWLAERVAQVTAVENNPDWLREVQERAPGNVRLVLWDKPRVPKRIEGRFDLLLVDGEPVENRKAYLMTASRLVKAGGWVVLDNCNRPEYAEERKVVLGLAREFRMFHAGEGTYLNTEFFHLKDSPGATHVSTDGGKEEMKR